MKRRSFLKETGWGAAGILFLPTILNGCSSEKKESNDAEPTAQIKKELKLSLAQWSLNRQFFAKKLNPNDFASIAASTYDIRAIEYVNQFYVDHGENESFWLEMKQRANDAGVKSLLIMVDDEGDLGVADEAARKTSVENHYKWVHAAKILGCHSIRVNAFGEEDKTAFRSAIVNGMGQLAEYAAKEKINVIIENHGLFSSDAQFIAEIIQEVNLDNFGTLPDFGNWCTSAKWGSTQIECENVYDIYQGVSEFLPYAKGVSAKAYSFDENGEIPNINYEKMLKIVKNSDFDGYIGIEYEGENLSEHDGIIATKALLEKVWASLV